MRGYNFALISQLKNDHGMIETRCLKIIVLFLPTILSFVLSRKIEFDEKQIETFLSNYKYFSGQSSSLLLLIEDSKNHYRVEIISVCNAEI